jgi:hypothetical protein
METTKKRTLNELRQEKEYGYRSPINQKTFQSSKVDSQHIVDLTKKYPNDAELGKNVRSYLINLGIYE